MRLRPRSRPMWDRGASRQLAASNGGARLFAEDFFVHLTIPLEPSNKRQARCQGLLPPSASGTAAGRVPTGAAFSTRAARVAPHAPSRRGEGARQTPTRWRIYLFNRTCTQCAARTRPAAARLAGIQASRHGPSAIRIGTRGSRAFPRRALRLLQAASPAPILAGDIDDRYFGRVGLRL